MKLKRKKKAIDKTLPLVAAGAGAVVLGAIALLLGSRRRRQKTKGVVQEATAPVRHAGREYDDVTLARKVESEILRDPDAPKGAIAVSAQHGVVELRGVVGGAEELEALGKAAAKVTGVQGVTNLLHTPGSEPKQARGRERWDGRSRGPLRSAAAGPRCPGPRPARVSAVRSRPLPGGPSTPACRPPCRTR